MALLSPSAISDINAISRFLAHAEIPSLHDTPSVDVLVFCGSALLTIVEHVFSALEARPELAETVVLCGGIGHSTRLLYEAIETNEKYSHLADKVQGLPESRVLELILKEHYPRLSERGDNGGLTILIEDKSTNCGANAAETRRILERHSIPLPRSMIVVQDPSMSLRTLASFKRTYADVSPTPTFLGCPTFVPGMSLKAPDAGDDDGELHFTVPGIPESVLWESQRFFDLIMGEIPRLRDDEHGYGPNGKGFIAHVDIPDDVEAAWARLREILGSQR
jgi:uncharacterized SAM-binding protein YcdF (DUF218 family)